MKKKSILWIFFVVLSVNVATIALAQHNTMVKKIDYMNDELTVVGLDNFEPFSDYVEGNAYGSRVLRGAFLKPLLNTLQNHSVKWEPVTFNIFDQINLDNLVFQARAGEFNVFIGAYAHTKKFDTLQLIYPAVVSNPIHIISLPDNLDKIKNRESLKDLRGIVVDSEFFDDFSTRKIKELNVEHVATPIEAYEKLFTEQADYILGGLYYNRIMASRYGLDPFLSYSKEPLFKIPVFVALSKTTPKFSLYKKALEEAFENPEFGKEVKAEILHMVEDELAQNAGIVPPSFAQKTQQAEEKIDAPQLEEKPRGHIIEQQKKQKTFDEVLEGIGG